MRGEDVNFSSRNVTEALSFNDVVLYDWRIACHEFQYAPKTNP